MSQITCYQRLLSLSLTRVGAHPIPAEPIAELKLDLSQPLLYVLPYHSQSDLLLLRKNCLHCGLPDPLEPNVIGGQSLPRYVFVDNARRFGQKSKGAQSDSVGVFERYLALHQADPSLNVQLVPASAFWGRAPGNEQQMPSGGALNRLVASLWWHKDNFVRFSQAVSLQKLVQEQEFNEKSAQKLARVARIHFARQRFSATGPRLPDRQAMFSKLLQSAVIQEAIEDEARAKKLSLAAARKEAEKILDEIAADVSYRGLRLADRFLGWLWNHLYQGIQVKNGDRVRQLALDGHEIIYVPCHRSHMDYLLLSYVLYHQGLFPPHIAAGINLNFWPAGPMFRRGGAFFIRRTFKGNRLYSTLFREYLAELFYRGYSVEYFIEGGRSRTGRLLEPKTGMMSMTLQALQRGLTRPISIVPVYIGYENVLEVDTYAKELRGAKKEKENAGLVLRVLKKLRNLGQGFVNFGEPIAINHYLNQHHPDWKRSAHEARPKWLNEAVDSIAQRVMVHINNAAAVNALNLIGTILLSVRQHALSKTQLLAQLESMLTLLRNVPYSVDMTLPEDAPDALLAHVLGLSRTGVYLEKDQFGELVRLDETSATLMTYYRNNIQHLTILPSLIANILLHHPMPTQETVLESALAVYPFLQAELFMHFNEADARAHFSAILAEFERQQIVCVDAGVYRVNEVQIRTLQLYSAGARDSLQRYFLALSLLTRSPELSRSALEKESCLVAKRLAVLHGIHSPEFFDKAIFSTFSNALKKQGYFDEEGNVAPEKVQHILARLEALISPEIQQSVQQAMQPEQP